jgi:hypothetical protein
VFFDLSGKFVDERLSPLSPLRDQLGLELQHMAIGLTVDRLQISCTSCGTIERQDYATYRHTRAIDEYESRGLFFCMIGSLLLGEGGEFQVDPAFGNSSQFL